MRRSHLLLRRPLSAAAGPAPAASAEAAPSRLMPALGGVASLGAVASGIAFLVTKRFVEQQEFREQLRMQYESIARIVEDTLLPEYAPATWTQQVRIEDDLKLGVQETRAPQLVSALNSGAAPRVPSTPPGIIGQNYFGRFLNPPKDAKNGAATATDGALPSGPSVSPAQQQTRAHAAAAAATSLLGSRGSATNMLANAESVQAAPLEPIAPDEEDDDAPPALSQAHRSIELARRLLDSHGGPDGARWGEADEAALISAWTGKGPPAMPGRLLVPEPAARKYEQVLNAYLNLGTGSGDAGGAGGSALPASLPDAAGHCLIALPEAMHDGAYLEHAEGEAAVHSKAAAASAATAERLQRLRVQEAYAEAEALSIEASMRKAQHYARRGHGGGTALQRMTERRRILTHKLADIGHEKRSVKREAKAAAAALEQEAQVATTASAA